MQESQEIILWEAQKLVAHLDDTTITDLCSEECDKRGKAVVTILWKLNPQENPNDNNIFQSLPIALISSWEHIGTLFFLQYCIENWAFFDPKVISVVIEAIATERAQCMDDGDSEAVWVITQILHKLYNIILAHPEYRKLPEIYLSIGTDQERDKNILGAIELYNEALWLGSIDAYFYVGTAYESRWDYVMSASIFDAGYQLSGEIRFLHRYIHALCKLGRREEAYTYYLHLQKQSKDVISPFIVYVDAIHSDDDLREFDLLMTSYHSESTFEPSESLRNLTSHASLYISNEIEQESSTIEKLNLVPIEIWTDEQDSIYREAIKRRLYLMQTHIITLQDPRFLDFYLDETKRYTVEGNERMKHMMNGYFVNSFSSYTYASYRQISWDESSRIEDMELFESMRLHLVQIAAIFSQHSFYETIRDKITPFVDECMKSEWTLDNDDLESPDEDVQQLKKDSQSYEALSESSKKLYENYIEFIDKKYWMFYRRSIQQLVRDEEAIPVIPKEEYEKELKENPGNHIWARNKVTSNMRVFLEYPDIALLFFLEKIILWQDLFSEEETMEWFIEKYNLNSLILLDALLFSWILYESGEYDNAIEYMMNVPWILDVPQVLYMIAECIRYMDDEENPDKILGELDIICQEEYDAKSFSEHISNVTQDIFESKDPSDEEISYILMAHANMQIIQEWDPHEVVTELNLAWEYGLSKWYISAGDILEESWEYDRAIEIYHKAYLLSPNIISIRRLLNVLLVAGRFDKAWEHIEMAIRDDYDVSGYVSAWYLYQWRNKEAIEEMCKIIQSSGMIDMILPDWYMEILSPSAKEILDSSESSIEQATLKILTSYLNASLSSENEESDPADYVDHISYIWWLMDEYKSEDVAIALLKSIPLLTGKIDFDDDISDIDKAMGYLHLHLTKIHNILERYHKGNQNNRDIAATRKTFELINALSISSITLLQRFPESEKYLVTWRSSMNLLPTVHDVSHTIHGMPEMVQ